MRSKTMWHSRIGKKNCRAMGYSLQTGNNLYGKHTKELGLRERPKFSPVSAPHTSVSGTMKEQMCTYSQQFGATTVWKHPW